MKIGIVGLGYVGLANSILLAQHHEVTAYDIDQNRIQLLKQKKSPIEDKDIEEYLQTKNLNIHFTDKSLSPDYDIYFISTPTNYDVETKQFCTRSIEDFLDEMVPKTNEALFVIKSTIPIGYVETLRVKYQTNRILFSPEFLREGKALHDNLYPQRIIVGDRGENGQLIAQLLQEGAKADDIPIELMGENEAEAVKLFSNTYLAMRVAYFNESDTFAAVNHLNTKEIINGMGYDYRIGDYYNNPSFGYGGYCLPKDTKELEHCFQDIPQNLITSIVQSNETRIQFIVDDILAKKPDQVGIYRLAMKQGSDNFRSSSTIEVIKKLKDKTKVVLYEPLIESDIFEGCQVIHNLDKFKQESQLIVTNRVEPDLQDVKEKIYTRDVYHLD